MLSWAGVSETVEHSGWGHVEVVWVCLFFMVFLMVQQSGKKTEEGVRNRPRVGRIGLNYLERSFLSFSLTLQRTWRSSRRVLWCLRCPQTSDLSSNLSFPGQETQTQRRVETSKTQASCRPVFFLFPCSYFFPPFFPWLLPVILFLLPA